MALRVVLPVALIWLLATAGQAAARDIVRVHKPFDTPQLTADGVVYGTTTAGGSPQVRLARPGKSNRVLRSFGPPAPNDYLFTSFDASAQALVVVFTRVRLLTAVIWTTEEAVTAIAPLEGPARSPACATASDFHVDGGRVAYVCRTGERQWIRVENAATGAEVAQVDVPEGSGYIAIVDLAGHYLAFAALEAGGRGPVVVWDLAKRRELYRVGGTGAAALGPDGTLVTLRDKDWTPCNDVAWFSVAEPRAHVTRGCALGPDLEVDGDRIVTPTAVDGRFGLGVTSLGDGRSRFIGGNINAFDIDRRRVAYACGAEAIVIERVDERGTGCTTVPPDPGLPRVQTKQTRASDHGEVRLTVACRAGCHGKIVLARDGRTISASSLFWVNPERTATVTLRLRAGMRILRGAVTVQARVTRLDGGSPRTHDDPLRVLPPRR